MEEYKEENNNKKRARDDSEDSVGVHSPESKLARVGLANSDDDNSPESNANASRDSGGVEPVAMRIRDDLLDIFDDTDPDTAIQGLDSVMRSLEEEILNQDLVPPVVSSDAGESRAELGYLLEASDDELGLPPSFSSGGEDQKIDAVDLETIGSGPGPVTLDGMGLEFDDCFEPYKFGIGGESDTTSSNDFITLGGGLFDSFETGDISELLWRPESLSAS
ncbi:hypothetical protein JRO89_XS13G0014200 [Xanthoceras sorbifolium]|uniref:Uncharacterized protein n=1 Tax=Xanthoceras sorbifolium TaxID=99658 RepID=A0ABQ8H5X4_9ROSI|nr:hypothetical protein JRO89_XS13G0014200 [Xanthoceras sorbifolium]